MKKFLALACVCAGLVAFAAPKVNHATPNMVTKSNTLVNQLTAPAMKMAPAINTNFHQFAKTHDLSQNMIKNTNGPRRSVADFIATPRFVSLTSYDWAFNDDVCEFTESAIYQIGGWDLDLAESEFEGCNVEAGLYYTLPTPMNYDEANGTLSIPTGYVIYSVTGSRVYKNRKYQDTTEMVIMMNEGWMNGDDFEDVVGEVFGEGSVYFEDGWAYLFIDVINYYSSSTSTTVTSSDTSMSVSKIFRDTYFLVPNAVNNYTSNSSGSEYNADVFMYQYDDSTAVIWNLFGYGTRGIVAYIYPDGNMVMPCYQIGCYDDVSSYASQYSQYDWTGAEAFYIMSYDLEADDVVQDDIVGTCTTTSLEWPVITMYDLISDSEGTFLGLGFYPFIDNSINFNAGYEFVFPAEIQDLAGQIVIGDPDEDGKVAIEYTGEEAVTLEVIDQDGNPYTIVDGCIQLPAYGEYTIIVTATAEGYNALEESKEVEWVEPVAPVVRGDVNNDGAVDPGDISALVEYLISGTAINEANADCNNDGEVGTADIATLIEYLLTEVWPAI